MDYAERAAGLRTHCQWQPRASSPLPPSAVPPIRPTDAPVALAPALCGRCAAASPRVGAGNCHWQYGRIMLMPASGWAGGCRFKFELGAWGTLPAQGLPGRPPASFEVECQRRSAEGAQAGGPLVCRRLVASGPSDTGTIVGLCTRPCAHVQETRKRGPVRRGMFVTRTGAALALRHAQWRSPRAVCGCIVASILSRPRGVLTGWVVCVSGPEAPPQLERRSPSLPVKPEP